MHFNRPFAVLLLGAAPRKSAASHAQPPMPAILEERLSAQQPPRDLSGMVSSGTSSSLTNVSRTSETTSHVSASGSNKGSGKIKGPMIISSPFGSVQRSSGGSTASASTTSTIPGLGEEDFVVQFDYIADEESKTSVRRGHVVTVLDSSMPDWWLVSVPELEDSEASEGYVPAKCLAKTQPPPIEASEASLYSPKQETTSQQSGFSNESETPPSLPPKRRTSQSVQPVPEQPQLRINVELRQKPTIVCNLPESIYIVQQNYTGEDESQVTVTAGQRVEAIDTTTISGWYMVQVEGNEMEGDQEGLIPSDLLGKTMPLMEVGSQRESEGVSERSSRGSDARHEGEPSETPESTTEVQEANESKEITQGEVPVAPPCVTKVNEDDIGAAVPVEASGQGKPRLKLDFQSELAAVLRR